MKALLRIGLWLLAFPLLNAVNAQCTNYTITVGGGTFDYEIDWELVNDQGITVASGVAPQTVNVCLPNGCYTMYMYDLFGDGWNGQTSRHFWVMEISSFQKPKKPKSQRSLKTRSVLLHRTSGQKYVR